MAPRSAGPTPLQPSLFAIGEPVVRTDAPWQRIHLDEWSWIDRCPGFVGGADDLLSELVATLPLAAHRRLMYGNWLDEPRLTCAAHAGHSPVVGAIGRALSQRYADDLRACWVNYYRDGSDSVAWHADRVGRTAVDPLVAIVSLGGPRTFALRPLGGGPSQSYVLHSGDALVMGGACQHRCEHSVPKTASAPPRLSLTFRNPRHFGDEP